MLMMQCNIFALTRDCPLPRMPLLRRTIHVTPANRKATNMINIAEQVNDMNNHALLAATRLSKLSLDSAERLLALQIGFAKSALGDATRNAKTSAGTQDVQQLLALRTKAAEEAMAQWMEYSRGLYEIASEAQSELSKLAEERLANLQGAITEAVDQAAKSAPAGSDVAVAAMKSSLAAVTSAFDAFNKAARNAASFADAGTKAASGKGR